MMHALGDFLLSEWLWSITLGIYQTPLAILFFFIVLYYFLHKRFIYALTMSLVCNLFSWIAYSLWVVVILIYILDYEYTLAELEQHPHRLSFFIPLSLALIYSLLQWLLLKVLPRRWIVSYRGLTAVIITANILAAVFVYIFLPKALKG